MNELDIIRNHFLGFHHDFFDSFRTVSTYPPYNIREKDDKGIIEFAVAGFVEDDLKVTVVENTLTVSGEKKEKNSEDIWHKGISDRKFKKTFQLHKHIVVTDAALKDGMLRVAFHRDVPELEKAHQIKIKKG
jgi:HSP20 family molecular chaperone IbpA